MLVLLGITKTSSPWKEVSTLSATSNKTKKAVYTYFREHEIRHHREKALIKKILELADNCRKKDTKIEEDGPEQKAIMNEFYQFNGNGEKALVEDLLKKIIQQQGRLNGDLHNK